MHSRRRGTINCHQFMSSPTAHRCGVKLLCAIASKLQWRIRALGISQAFSQSENLREEYRLAVLPPSMATLHWAGKLAPSSTPIKSLAPNKHGFLLLRPLYGGRDAPMRWWVTLSKRLRAHNFRQTKCDVCMFTKHDAQSRLIAFLVCHVGDILFTGTDEGQKDTEEALRTFRAGGTEKLSYQKPIISTGILLERPNEQTWEINMSQDHYAMELRRIDPAQFVTNAGVRDPKKLRTALRQALGALI